jgi:hypothetical protein
MLEMECECGENVHRKKNVHVDKEVANKIEKNAIFDV